MYDKSDQRVELTHMLQLLVFSVVVVNGVLNVCLPSSQLLSANCV